MTSQDPTPSSLSKYPHANRPSSPTDEDVAAADQTYIDFNPPFDKAAADPDSAHAMARRIVILPENSKHATIKSFISKTTAHIHSLPLDKIQRPGTILLVAILFAREMIPFEPFDYFISTVLAAAETEQKPMDDLVFEAIVEAVMLRGNGARLMAMEGDQLMVYVKALEGVCEGGRSGQEFLLGIVRAKIRDGWKEEERPEWYSYGGHVYEDVDGGEGGGLDGWTA
jgi:hypothetical protein